MGIVFRQSIKTTVVIFSGALLGVLVIYLQQLYIPKQQLGFIRNLSNQALIISQVTLFGINNMLNVFIQRYPPGDRKRPVLITFSLIVPLFFTAAFAILYFVFKEQVIHLYKPADVEYARTFFFWLPLYTLIWCYVILLEQYLMSQMKVALSSLMKEVVLRILNIGILLLFIFGLIEFAGLLALTVLVNLLPILLLAFFAKRTDGFRISFQWSLLSGKEYRDMAHFAWFHLLMSISVNLITYLDSTMLALLDKNGLSSVAVYSTAIFVVSIVQIPYRAMTLSTFVPLTQAFEAKDMHKTRDIYKRSSINILIAATAMVLLIACNSANIAGMLKEGYEAVAPLLMILLIGRYVDMATGLNSELISISKHYKFNFYLSGWLVVMIIVLNYFLIPRIGLYGAAWGTTTALILFNVAKLLFLWIKMRMHPFSNSSIRVIAAGLLTGAVGYFLPYFLNPVVDGIVRSVVIVIVYLLLLVILKPSQDLNEYLSSLRKNKRLF